MAGHDFDADAGLAINLAPGDSGIWQSMMLDPLPAGNYELRLRLAVAGEGPVRLDVAVRPLGAQGEPMGDRRLLVPVGRPDKIIITVPWTTDGSQTFRVAITARAESGGAKVLVSGMSARRIWPNLGGSPRYYEPSLIGHYD